MDAISNEPPNDSDSLEVGPNSFLAAATVEAALGGAVSTVRLRRGARHDFTFDAVMTDGRRAVVRLALPEGRAAMRSTLEWIERLKPLDVPVPRVLAFDLDSEFPSMVVQQLNGKRLGQVLARLPVPALGLLAGRLTEIQQLLAGLDTSGMPGRAIDGSENLRWSQVLQRSLHHSRERIDSAGLIPAKVVDRVEPRLERLAELLDHMPTSSFMVSRLLSEAVVSDNGHLVGFTDIGRFFRGDARVAPAFALVDLLNAGHTARLAEAWLALSGGEADATFWLYAATGCLHLMGDYGSVDASITLALKPSDRMRLESILDVTISRIDRLR